MIFAAALGTPFLLPQAAQAKPARCEITPLLNGEDRYVGPCEFVAKSGGSFSVKLPAKAADDLNISIVYVTVDSPGNGEIAVRGFMGNLNKWGIVRRDPKKPACWAGEWGRVCVY
jgi:hypothetical protein